MIDTAEPKQTHKTTFSLIKNVNKKTSTIFSFNKNRKCLIKRGKFP